LLTSACLTPTSILRRLTSSSAFFDHPLKGSFPDRNTAKLIGFAQPDISRLMRGNFEWFSYERLFHMLNALGENVRIVVTDAKPRTKAGLKSQFA